MADRRIANEWQAYLVGLDESRITSYSCSSDSKFVADKGATYKLAITLGCKVRGTYEDTLLVALEDLYYLGTYREGVLDCTCDSSYCSCQGVCSCNSGNCTCDSSKCSCESYCYCQWTCSPEGTSYYGCSCKGNCSTYKAASSTYGCSCQGNCSTYKAGTATYGCSCWAACTTYKASSGLYCPSNTKSTYRSLTINGCKSYSACTCFANCVKTYSTTCNCDYGHNDGSIYVGCSCQSTCNGEVGCNLDYTAVLCDAQSCCDYNCLCLSVCTCNSDSLVTCTCESNKTCSCVSPYCYCDTYCNCNTVCGALTCSKYTACTCEVEMCKDCDNCQVYTLCTCDSEKCGDCSTNCTSQYSCTCNTESCGDCSSNRISCSSYCVCDYERYFTCSCDSSYCTCQSYKIACSSNCTCDSSYCSCQTHYTYTSHTYEDDLGVGFIYDTCICDSISCTAFNCELINTN